MRRKRGAPVKKGLFCAPFRVPAVLSFSPLWRRRNRFIATANHHRLRLPEALVPRLPFSPCERRWPSRRRGRMRGAGRNETRPECVPSIDFTALSATPHSGQHPSSVSALRADPPSPTGGEGREPLRLPRPITMRLRLPEALVPRLPFSPCGRRWPSRRRGRMRGAGRNETRRDCVPSIDFTALSATPHSGQHPSSVSALRADPPSPTGGEGSVASFLESWHYSKSGDQAGSEAKLAVGIACSLRPVRSIE